MWRVGLAFIAHRLLLYAVALFTINYSLTKNVRDEIPVPALRPYSMLVSQFFNRVAEGSDAARLIQLSQESPGGLRRILSNPFVFLSQWLVQIMKIRPQTSLILLSNLFFLLFLWELYLLLNRMVTFDTGSAAAVLAMLFPTSYELSLISDFSLVCLLTALSIRTALDNQWIVSGLAWGLLAFMEPMALGLLPLLAVIFWYFQRHFYLAQVLKRALFFLIPAVIATLVNFASFRGVVSVISQSAFVELFSSAKFGQDFGWTLSHSKVGQTILGGVLLIGGIAAAVVNLVFVHKLIPLWTLLLLILFSPYGEIGSRALLAGSCMEGIATVSARPVYRFICFLMLLAGIYEVFLVFR